MSVTFKYEVRLTEKKQDGTYNVKIRLTKDQKITSNVCKMTVE